MPCYVSGNNFYQVFTSQSILDEFGYHWRKKHPKHDDKAREKIIALIRRYLTVVEGYEIEVIDGYPDVDDLHVHSAVLACEADALITNDTLLLEYALSNAGLESLPYETITCDDFLMQLTEYVPSDLFCQIYLKQEEYWNKFNTNRTIPEQLRISGAPQFASYLQHRVIPHLP